MKKFAVVIELSMEDAKYAELEKWNVAPTDHVATILTEPLREKGFIVKAYAVETDHSLYERQKKHQDHLLQADAYNDLENEIISRACVGGVCED